MHCTKCIGLCAKMHFSYCVIYDGSGTRDTRVNGEKNKLREIVGVLFDSNFNVCKCIRVDNNNGTMPNQLRENVYDEYYGAVVANIVIVVIQNVPFCILTKFYTFFSSLLVRSQ